MGKVIRGNNKGIKTLLLTQAMFIHDAAKNHTGCFGSCEVPLCKYARQYSGGADVDVAKAFADKERVWLKHISDLEQRNVVLVGEVNEHKSERMLRKIVAAGDDCSGDIAGRVLATYDNKEEK